MADSSSCAEVLAGLADTRDWQEGLYRDLHQHPELSHREERTAGVVAEQLRDMGYEVHEHVGGTGVVAVLGNGDGPGVLLRADMDALPVAEATGLPYASTRTVHDDGDEVAVMHACGHDVHVACLLGAAQLLADGRAHWSGTVVALFQPAEETGDGAQAMLDDRLDELLPRVDVVLGQHVLATMPAGTLGTRPGPTLAAADSMRIVVHGRGAHASSPQASIDPVILAAMIAVRLQTVVAREISPTEPAVLTVASIQAGRTTGVIPETAELQLNIRTYSEATRTAMLQAVRRIVTAECEASRSPRPPDFEMFGHFPLTVNDPAVTGRVHEAFAEFFGEQPVQLSAQTASEDFSHIPTALGVPYTYWAIGGTEPETYARAEGRGTVAQDVPANHSPRFAPAIQPTLDTGTQALVVAALAWLTGQR